MSGTTKVLHVAWGRSKGTSVAAVVARLVEGDAKAAILWCDPTPQRSRQPNFPCLWAGTFNGLAGVPLDEARLFWTDGWLHLVADGDNTRWAAFRQDAEPPWLGPQDGQIGKEDKWDVIHEEGKVLLLSDWKRYGITPPPPFAGQAWSVDRYTRESRLVGWNLRSGT